MYKNKGFGIVGIITIIAVLAVIGFVGWRVYEAMKPSTQSTTSQPSTSQTDTAIYLHIKELGVKIKLSDDIKDAVYYYSGDQANFSTSSLASKGGSDCQAQQQRPLGSIRKQQTLQALTGATLKVDNTSVFQIGAYYYVFQGSQALCNPDNAEATSLQTKQVQAFKEAIKTIQADN